MALRNKDLVIETFPTHHVISQPNPLRRALRRMRDGERDDSVARAEAALESLSAQFSEWMRAEAQRLLSAYAEIAERGFDRARRDAFFRAAHDIKGDGATFGYDQAGLAAESLCRLLEHAPDIDAVPRELIEKHVKAIDAIVREHETRARPEVERRLAERLRDVTDAYLAAVTGDRPESLATVAAPGLAPAD